MIKTHNHREKGAAGLRGFVAYVAAALWFLLTILGASPSMAAEGFELEMLKEKVSEALIVRGASPAATIRLDNPGAAAAQSEFEQVTFNPGSGRFFIRRADQSVLTGFALETAYYPVLTRAISRGETIAPEDIEFIELAVTRTAYLSDAEDLAGMEARRPLGAGAPLRASDLARPMLIRKGAVVTLNYTISGLRLTHQGVALAGGGEGDVIAVKNPQSELVVKAVVTARNQARVFAPAQQIVGG